MISPSAFDVVGLLLMIDLHFIKMRTDEFRKAFSVREGPDGANPFSSLVKKLVSMLEHVEKFPLVVHDTPGSGHGLQVWLTVEAN